MSRRSRKLPKAIDIHPGALQRPKHQGTEQLDCDPTPEQIRAKCLEIQATWCDAERHSRIVDRRYLGEVEVTRCDCIMDSATFSGVKDYY